MQYLSLKSFFYSILVLLFFIFQCNNDHTTIERPKSVKGVIDLSYHNFNPLKITGEDGIVPLDGEWEFYWKEFLPANNLPLSIPELKKENNSSLSNFINVPSNWNNYEVNGKSIGGHGYATYRLRVLLPSRFNREEIFNDEPLLGLKIPDIGTSYKLYINGIFITEVGHVEKTAEKTKSFYLPQIITVPNYRDQIEILMYVANFQHSRGGVWNSIQIGKWENLQKQRDKKLTQSFLLFGALLLMGMYHLGLFLIRTKDKSTIYFSIFCLLMAIRALTSDERYIYLIIPEFPWEWNLRLDFLTLYTGVPFFTLFFYTIFPGEMPDLARRMILYISSILSLCVIALPIDPVTRTLQIMHFIALVGIINSLYSMLKAIYHNQPGAKSFFIGFILFALIIVNDILHSNGLINTGLYSPFGFLIFVFSQAFFLSIRFSSAFNKAEELTANLESLVHKRTKELLSAKIETEDLNTLIKSLNEELELKLIMQKVLNYVSEKFGVKHFGLYSLNTDKKHITLMEMSFPEYMSEEDRNIIYNLPIPIHNVKSSHAFAFKAKKPFYIPKVKKSGSTKEELFIIEKYKITSIILIPLLLNNEPIGILDLSNPDKMNLTKEDIIKLSILAEQLAGIFYSSKLFKQVQEEKVIALLAKNEAEKEKALVAQKQTELSKFEIEKLNEFTRLINSTSDISIIINEIFSYLNRFYKFDSIWILLVDKNKNEIFSDKALGLYNYLNSANKDFFNNFRYKINETLGTLYQTYTEKVPFYIPDANDPIGGNTNQYLNPINGKIYSGNKLDLKIMIKGHCISFCQFPLIVKNEIVGILNLGYYQPSNLSQTELNQLTRFADQIAGVIYNAQLMKETEDSRSQAEIEKGIALIAQHEAEEERTKSEKLLMELNEALDTIKKDLKLSKRIQNSMFDHSLHTIEGLTIHVNYSPMQEVGGDFYNIKEIAPGVTRFFIADATGHGVQAALITMLIKSEYENLCDMEEDCSALLTVLNSTFVKKYNFNNMLFSCAVFDIDINKNKIFYSFAGHPPQVLLTKQELKEIAAKGKLIGIIKEAVFFKHEIEIEHGDKLLLFTDGVYEEVNPDNKMFGENRLYESFQKYSNLSIDQIINHTLADLMSFINGNRINDDITMIGIEIN